MTKIEVTLEDGTIINLFHLNHGWQNGFYRTEFILEKPNASIISDHYGEYHNDEHCTNPDVRIVQDMAKIEHDITAIYKQIPLEWAIVDV